jgi:hypothetical protein
MVFLVSPGFRASQGLPEFQEFRASQGLPEFRGCRASQVLRVSQGSPGFRGYRASQVWRASPVWQASLDEPALSALPESLASDRPAQGYSAMGSVCQE